MSLLALSSSPSDAVRQLSLLSEQLNRFSLTPESSLREYIQRLQCMQADTAAETLKSFALFLSEHSLEALGIKAGLDVFRWLFFAPDFEMQSIDGLKEAIGLAIKKHWTVSSANTWHHYFGQRNVVRDSCEAYLEFLLEKVNDTTIVNGSHSHISSLLGNAWELLFASSMENNAINAFILKELQRFQSDICVLLFVSALSAFLHLDSSQVKLVDRLICRYKQLMALAESNRGFSHVGAFRLAYFVEVSLPFQLQKGLAYFKKEHYGLPRTVICESSGSIYILSKSKVKLLDQVTGTYKKFRTAIQLAPMIAFPAQLVAHGVNIGGDYAYSAAIRELVFARELRGKESIALFLGHQCHEKRLADDSVQKKVDTFWHLYDGTLQEVRNGSVFLDHRSLLSVVEDVISGLYEIHQMNIIHGDLKLPNILFKRVGRKVRAYLTDFGLSFVYGRENPSLALNDGYYGSVWFTAPELFGRQDFQGDFFQAEVFALGVLLYQLYCLKEPLWVPFLDTCHKQNVEITQGHIQQFEQLVYTHIEPAIQREERAAKPTNKLLYLILRMLRTNPKERISLAQALQEIQEINS